MEVFCEFKAWGHPNVRATHPTTLELTREARLTPKGDCIVAVKAQLAAAGLPADLKRLVRREGSTVTLELEVEGLRFQVKGLGSPRLTLTHPSDLVARKSGYACPRTLMIHADKAAADMPRKMVEALKAEVSVQVRIKVRPES
ncbi:TPA: DUF371 domain-containing protein [Candidatus Bathyarchaeota archaeon]|nr:DUF371 domain-containing protein [Candidatus Bathyarchaeota archaeon]